MDQDLLGLVCGELSNAVVAAHQTGKCTGLHQLLGRCKGGQAQLHRSGNDHVLGDRSEKAVRWQVQPLSAARLQFAIVRMGPEADDAQLGVLGVKIGCENQQ